MSHPEISRRCLECGASVRADARFCPQCGKAMRKESLPPDNGAAQRNVPTTRDVHVTAGSQPASANFDESTGRALDSPANNIEPSSNAPARANESAAVATTTAAAVAPEIGSATTAGAKPLATVAQQESQSAKRRPAEMVKDNLRPRVEKLRDASMTVLEEASDDTGLRFVLIAVVLFLLFLLFLFLNNIIR